MRSLPLIGFFAFLGCLPLLLSSKTHALPGLSSVWERLYNNNEPFSETNPSHAPTADPDGDGWNNLRESIAGTNPFSGLPPNGFPQLIISPHPWLENQFELALPVTYPGKDYLFSHSTTLQTGSWTDFPEAFPGTGEDLIIPFQPESEGGGAPPDKAFFRASISDQPNPGGTFTPWELAVLSNRQDIALAVLPAPTVTDGADEPPPDPNGDGDRLTDRYDASPQDNQVEFLRTPESRYIHIPVAGVPHPFKAIDVSDSGKILFGGNVSITDVTTQPVGYVWNPLAEPSQRLTPVMFSPVKFSLVCRRITDSATTYPEEQMPLPGRDAPPNSVSLGVNLRAIGDDGSVLANVSYQLRENDGHVEGEVRSADAQLVFLWQQNQYGACSLIGEHRGYSDEGQIISRDHAIGFYSEENVTPRIVRAVTTKQDARADRNLVSPLYILASNTTTLSSNYLSGQPTRKGTQEAFAGRITRTGKVLLTDLINNEFRHLVCGTTQTEILPQNTIFDNFSDFPNGLTGAGDNAGKWGFGTRNQAFRIRKGGEFKPVPSALNVQQWDKYGTGIGPSATQAIWRNGRMRSLAEVVQNPPGDAKPRKITPSGLIWVGNDAGTTNGLLVPVEVVAPDIDHNELESTEYPPLGADELKVAKMEHSLDENGVLKIDGYGVPKHPDPHRFHVGIPSALNNGFVQIRLATVGHPDTAYDDNPDWITLNPAERNRLESQSMILVSGNVDDAADGEDNRENDRTHKIQLGGKVRIESVKLGGSTYPLTMDVPVKVKKIIEGKIILVGSTITDGAAITEHIKIAKERYAQLGLKFNLTIASMDVPDGVVESRIRYNTEGSSHSGHVTFDVHEDVKKLVDKANLENKRGIVTVFVVVDTDGASAKGFSIRKGRVSLAEAQYANVAVISAIKTIRRASYGFTIAHEVGHIITDAGHYGNPDEGESYNDYYGSGSDHQIEYNLLRNGTSSSDTMESSKRLYILQKHMLINELLLNP